MPSPREKRSEIMRHLYSMHGGIDGKLDGKALSGEVLERVHGDLHLDDFMCPPHQHTAESGIEFSYGENYVDEIKERYASE